MKDETAAHGLTSFDYYVDLGIFQSFNIGRLKENRSAGILQNIDKTIFIKLLIPKIINRSRILYIDSDTLIGNCLSDITEQYSDLLTLIVR